MFNLQIISVIDNIATLTGQADGQTHLITAEFPPGYVSLDIIIYIYIVNHVLLKITSNLYLHRNLFLFWKLFNCPNVSKTNWWILFQFNKGFPITLNEIPTAVADEKNFLAPKYKAEDHNVKKVNIIVPK